MTTVKKKLIAINFPPKNTSCALLGVQGNNLYWDKCGDEALEDSAYMSSASYREIFGKNRSRANRFMKRLAVVKIHSSKTKRSIYRKYVYSPLFAGLNNSSIALNPSSIRELGDNDELVGRPITVSPGSVFLYYWNHPFHATRISMKLGIVSIFLALTSIALSLFLSTIS